jgi:hypothetical protein
MHHLVNGETINDKRERSLTFHVSNAEMYRTVTSPAGAGSHLFLREICATADQKDG